MPVVKTQCCIAGGGPAGMMLGLLLARAGVDVVVLEKHGDFLRDFRGDTIHPSTLEIMHELGILDQFLKRPHQKVERLGVQFGDRFLQIGDFTALPTRCKFIVMMPQWEFLDFIAQQGRAYNGFHLRMDAKATELIEAGGRIIGAHVRTSQGELNIHADLTIGADGRHSTLRRKAGLPARDLGAPIDVMWMRLSRRPSDPEQSMGRIGAGEMLVMINRRDYWQCAFVIPKGGFVAIRERGLEEFRRHIGALAPFLADRLGELGDWADTKFLNVTVDRLQPWYGPGFLCIGDAAHAMSPIGGVGINLAIQDAVAAANILAEKLRTGAVADRDLAAVERRRMLPTRLTQGVQILMQNRLIGRVLTSRRQLRVPLIMRLLLETPLVRRISTRLLAVGFRPEHVRTTMHSSAPRNE